MLHRLLVLFAGSCLSLVGQTIPVSGGGAALSNAIVAAPPGAVLVVAPGTYSPVSLTVAKDVTIVAPQGATVEDAISLTMTGPRLLRICNVHLVYTGPWYSAVLWTNGSLHAEYCSATGAQAGNSTTRGTVYMQGCGFGTSSLTNVDAVLLDCVFVGGHSSASGYSGLIVSGSLRGERLILTGSGGYQAGGYGLGVNGDATLADCVMTGGNSAFGQAYSLAVTGQCVLSNCTLNGPTSGTFTQRTLATAIFATSAWQLGGTSAVTFTETPNRPFAIVLAGDLVPTTHPLALEPLFFGATPNWAVAGIATTGALGQATVPFVMPNVAALQYHSLWLTGVFFDPLPARTTCPIGGIVR
jgi:hypothetical protein